MSASKIYLNNQKGYYNIRFLNNNSLSIENNVLDILDIRESTTLIKQYSEYYEVGPSKHCNTAFSSNVINILNRLDRTIADTIISFDYIKLYDVNSEFKYDTMLECIWNNPKYKETHNDKHEFNYPKNIELNNSVLKPYGIEFDKYEIEMYRELYKSLCRLPTFIELYDLCQSNSEHSRHWFFKGNLFPYNSKKYLNHTLFDMIKSTLIEPNNSLVAFSDNSSVIKGFEINQLIEDKQITKINKTILDIVLTAETHNFPTLICPFEGANTGVGGRIRDNHATGRGAYLIASLAGYCVGDVNFNESGKLKYGYNNPLDILIEASNGASDYGNKIGEPIIGGFTRSYGDLNTEWIKPVMFSAGIGSINNNHLKKGIPQENMCIVRIGGPAYKIGLGGGFSSSLDQTNNREHLDWSAVQRGDPQMGNRLNRVIKRCCDMGDVNPIISIHDQGSGGLANVVKEIVYPNGGIIYLDNVTLGDNTMNPLEIWCCEFQESDVLLINNENIELLEELCLIENICCDILGSVTDTGKIVVKWKDELLINLPLKEILDPRVKKNYILDNYNCKTLNNNFNTNKSFDDCVERVLSDINVCSKRFLTNKVDRSVSGQIVQQQCVGPFHTPLSNYSLTSLGYFNNSGIATAIGEKPLLGLYDPKAQGSMSVGEMITNMMAVYIGDINKIKCSANWMWATSIENESSKLYIAAKEMCYAMKELGIGIDGGKDSLSMCVKNNDTVIKSPGELVITGYAPCSNINKRVTPDLKQSNSNLVLIDFSGGKTRMGGSIFLKTCVVNGLNNKLECPIIEDYNGLTKAFNIVQSYIYSNKILALHDKSDGGLITTISEMAMSSKIGVDLTCFENETKNNDLLSFLFNEELGLVCEIENIYLQDFLDELTENSIKCNIVGYTNESNEISIWNNNKIFNVTKLSSLIFNWEKTSYELEKFQANKKTVNLEYLEYPKMIKPYYYLPNLIEDFCNTIFLSGIKLKNYNKPKIAIVRDEGSNGDKEMCAAFLYVGFEVLNISMNELIKTPEILKTIRGIAYVGGFTHGDALGAGHGWHISIKNNKKLSYEFDAFMKRKDIFSLGVCNGCQLMIKMGIYGDKLNLVKNDSERFESRFSIVQIRHDNNIFFKNMKNMVFGIWVAHGEGKFINTDLTDSNNHKIHEYQKVLKYAQPTGSDYLIIDDVKYPYNPNGSQESLAGLVSQNGRHLALMPHPERCFMKWQLPYKGDYNEIQNSPWLMMFKNIYDWCVE